MNDDERDILKRLAPGPTPKPPAGLLEKLKADIPERLPSNVRPFRPRMPVMALRIAATVFVAGGALFVLTHVRREELRPAASVAVPKPAEKPAAGVSTGTYASEQPAAADEPKRQQALQGRLAPADTFAPSMPKPAPEKVQSAPPPPSAPAPAAKALADEGVRAESRAAGQGAEEPLRTLVEKPAVRDEMKERQALKKESAAPEEAMAPAPPAPAARAAGALRAAPATEEKPAPALGELLGWIVRPEAARGDGRTYVLLSLSSAPRGDLTGGSVLSASPLPAGGCVVLAEARAPLVTLRAGSETATVEVKNAAATLDAASTDLRLAVLAWRLERARAAGDRGAQAVVAAEAEALAAADARAARLARAARP